MPVKYTDIDYVVFTDAARYVAGGSTPYRRATYRYSPLLAYLMVPNIWLHPAWGKVLFSAGDLVAAALMSHLLRRTGAAAPLRTAALALWLFNPYTATISTRGSCDVLSVLLLLGLLTCLLHGRPLVSGALYGLAVHFRIYPVIYGPAITLFLARRAHAAAVERRQEAEREAGMEAEGGERQPRAGDGGHGAAGRGGASTPVPKGGEKGRRSASPASAAKAGDRRNGDGTAAAALGSTVSGSPAETRRRRTPSAAAARQSSHAAAAAAAVPADSIGGDSPSRVIRKLDMSPGSGAGTRKGEGVSAYLRAVGRGAAVLRPVALFSLAAAATFVGLGAFFYLLYGNEFLREAFVHHLTRKDPRHNFSPYYYPVYLSYGGGGGGAAGGGPGAAAAAATAGDAWWAAGARSGDLPLPLPPAAPPSAADPTGSGAAAAAAAGLVPGLLGLAWTAVRRLAGAVPLGEPWRLALVPQATALLAVAFRFHEDLPVAWLLQTWCFVTLNKVVTAQYFVWYLSLLPLALPALVAQTSVSWRALAAAGAAWVAAQLHWLAWAYQLEMRGRSVHVPLWAAGLLFQAANTVVVVLLMRALRRPPRQRPRQLQPSAAALCNGSGEAVAGTGGASGGADGAAGVGSRAGKGCDGGGGGGGGQSSDVDGSLGGGGCVMSFLEASLALARPPPAAAIAAVDKKRV